jgi:V/A-type H+-transporting ATPase subunit A
MTGTKGTVVAVNGNMVSVRFDGAVSMNEVGFVKVADQRLKSEVIRIRGDISQLQVFEITKGIAVGDTVEYTGDMLVVELGPGLLGQVFDGLQNPLPKLAAEAGYFLERGVYLDPLPADTKWEFTPAVKAGDRVERADTLGTVPEGSFTHRIMTPFGLHGTYTVVSIKEKGSYTIRDQIAELQDEKGNKVPVTMSFRWPVKRAVDCYEERLKPEDPMVTRVRLIDTFFPVARGGTYCIPGPFGGQDRTPADHQPPCRCGHCHHRGLRRAGRGGGGNPQGIPRIVGSQNRPIPDGTDYYHLQYLLHARGGPGSLGLHRSNFGGILPADGA